MKNTEFIIRRALNFRGRIARISHFPAARCLRRPITNTYIPSWCEFAIISMSKPSYKVFSHSVCLCNRINLYLVKQISFVRLTYSSNEFASHGKVKLIFMPKGTKKGGRENIHTKRFRFVRRGERGEGWEHKYACFGNPNHTIFGKWEIHLRRPHPYLYIKSAQRQCTETRGGVGQKN